MNEQIFDLFIKSIKPELFVILLFVVAVGLMLKLVPVFKDEWKIPFIQWALSIMFTWLWLVLILEQPSTAAAIVIAIVQGTLIVAVAVLGYQFIKQPLVKRIEDNRRKKITNYKM